MEVEVIKVPIFSCLACGKPIPSEQHTKLFCSDLCKEMAKYVRYYRACRIDGREKDSLVQQALNVRLFWILAGGYNQLQRKVSPITRRIVLDRDNHKCRQCGGEGNQLDHIIGNNNDENNLQVLCLTCHLKKTLSSITVKNGKVDFDFRQSLVDLNLSVRIDSPEPICACDDESLWNSRWKSILEERREIYFQIVRQHIHTKTFDSNAEVRNYLIKSGILTFSGRPGWSKEYIRELRENRRRTSA